MPVPGKSSKRQRQLLEASLKQHNEWGNQFDPEEHHDEVEFVSDTKLRSIQNTHLLVGQVEVPHGGYLHLISEWVETLDGKWHMQWNGFSFDRLFTITWQRELGDRS